MHGCIRRACLPFIFIVFTVGCTEARAPAKPQAADTSVYGAAYDEAATGTLSGTVHWQGELPQAPPFKIFGLPGDYPVDVRKDQPNPNLPRIEPSSLAMRDVVVFLRQVDVQKAKPWDVPKARIELRERQLHVHQGKSRATSVGCAPVTLWRSSMPTHISTCCVAVGRLFFATLRGVHWADRATFGQTRHR